MTSTSSECLLEPATGFTGSSMTMVSSNGFACASASNSQASNVYWSNSPLDRTVVDSTALGGCGGGHMTCLTAAHLAASFHVLPVIAFSNCHLANSSMTSVMHSEVRPAFFAEPMEDYDILVHPFIPFRTCGWGSQPHTAIIAIW